MKDDASKPIKASKDALLGELESIRELLDKYQDEDSALNYVPVLDDVVNQENLSRSKTNGRQKPLDLDSIFEDGDDFVLEQDNATEQEESIVDFDQLEDLDNLEELDIDINIPNFTLATTAQPDTCEDKNHNSTASIDIDLLVQEIVDECIPNIEAQLRQRLTAYSPKALKQLALKMNKA